MRPKSTCLKVDGEDGVVVLASASWCGSSFCLWSRVSLHLEHRRRLWPSSFTGSEQQRLRSRYLGPSLVSHASSLCSCVLVI
ncbi:unnamed protein product [Arabidopsis thaliana]|nr:unnamed protein product [Arabidopsis thaliana]VYS60488.1 unnamed protein product [Arabidopsis thaliana]